MLDCIWLAPLVSDHRASYAHLASRMKCRIARPQEAQQHEMQFAASDREITMTGNPNYAAPHEAQTDPCDGPEGDDGLLKQLNTLERRTYTTYNARLQASIRLARRSRAWNTSLVSLATSTTVASIGMLTDGQMYGSDGDTLLVCVAVLALVASLVTSGLDYSGRSRNMFVNYRKLQALSVKAERAVVSPSMHTQGVVDRLYDEYDALLDESENHTAGDHLRAQSSSFWSWPILRDWALTLLPYVTLLFPIGLLIPLVGTLSGLF